MWIGTGPKALSDAVNERRIAMYKKFVLVPLEEVEKGREALYSGLSEEQGGEVSSAGVCAGGHRVSGGAPGNGSGRGTDGQALSDIQLSWLSDSDLFSILEHFCFDISDLESLFNNYCERTCYSSKEGLRSFFEKDYLHCVSLLAELNTCFCKHFNP